METRNLYFKDSNGRYRLLHKNVQKDELSILINCFLDEHNFKSYYKGYWDVKNGTKIDFGSHTEFFLWGFVK